MTATIVRRTTAVSRSTAVGAIALAGALLLTGCGDQTKSHDTKNTSTAPLFAKLPAKYQASGVITVGTDASYAPMESASGGRIVGIDPDIASALGKQLGVKFEFVSGTFDGLITSLHTGRQDIVMSAMSDTQARQQGLDDDGKKIGAGVDFVDYFESGVSLLVKKGNPANVRSLSQLCGTTVAVQRGTIYETAFKDQAKLCGSKKLTIEAYDTDAQAQTRVKAGGAVADLNDYPVAAYIARTSGGGSDFEVAGSQTGAGPFGIAVDKSNTRLRDALRDAVDAIIADGTYGTLLKKWDVTDSAVSRAVINGGS
jgi:polar amino acid transport system substrate-binding protein